MDTIRTIVIFISLFSSLSAHPSVPSIIVQEGQSAEISCLAKGSHDAYFWWKGEYLHNSTEIASFVGGIPSSPTGSYTATENGTLIIKKVSLNDEGKYICRVSSTLSDCNGVLMVYVQAFIPGFALGIDLCDGDASCVIQIAPSKSTTLTCKATDASPSMALKWFNGSTEITEGIAFEDPVMTGKSRVISATLNVAPECAGSLICQAVDPKTKDDGGRFAHVQLELPGSAITKASTGWMVTAILFLVTCIILIAAFAFIIVKSKNTKGKDKNKPEEGVKLMEFDDKDKDIHVKQEKIEELTTKVSDRDNELKVKQGIIEELTTKVSDKEYELKVEQGKIEELTTKVNDRDNEIKFKQGKIEELTKSVYDATADVKVKDVSAKAETQIKDKELQVKVRELTKLQEEVKTKDNEIKTNVEEIYQLKAVIQSKDNKTEKKDEELLRLKAVIQSKDNETKEKDEELLRLKAMLHSKDSMIKLKHDELSRLNAIIKSKDEDLSRLRALGLKSNDISSKHEAAVKHEEESQNKLEKLKSDEQQIKRNFRNLENSERSFRAKKMENLEKNYVTVIPKEGSPVGIKRERDGFTLKHSGAMYKFPHIFSIGAAAREIYEKVNCYVENAVDGGDSLVIAFGTSRSTPHLFTMYGDTEWKSAILPLTYKTIFERANQLKIRQYSVKIRSRFVHVLEDENDKETFMLPESTFADTCEDPRTIPSVVSKDENSIERIFLEHRESIMKGSSKHNCFVQFVINTEDENNTITTGTITLATLLVGKVAKTTFEKEVLKSSLEKFLASIIYKPNSRCLLLAHLNEDKDDIKEVLKVAKTITEGKKK